MRNVRIQRFWLETRPVVRAMRNEKSTRSTFEISTFFYECIHPRNASKFRRKNFLEKNFLSTPLRFPVSISKNVFEKLWLPLFHVDFYSGERNSNGKRHTDRWPKKNCATLPAAWSKFHRVQLACITWLQLVNTARLPSDGVSDSPSLRPSSLSSFFFSFFFLSLSLPFHGSFPFNVYIYIYTHIGQWWN